MSDSPNTDSTWQDITPDRGRSPDPKLHIYANLNSYINAAGDRRWFDDHEAIRIKADPDGGRLGFVPDGEIGDDNYSLARDDEGRGADITTKRALKRLGLDEDTLVETVQVPLEEESGIVVADVGELLVPETLDGAESEEQDEADHETDSDVDPVAEADAQPQSNGHVVTDLTSPTNSTSNTQNYTIETPDLDNETRQDVLEYVLGATAGGRTVRLESREIGAELDIRSQTVAQHLRLLRDGDLDIPVDISLEDADEWERQKWRLDGHDVGGQTPDESTDDELDVVQEHIDNGVDDVHELAAKTGLACDRIRSLTREAGVYGDLTDAPEDGGYGRA